jgi:molybdopterin synthase catalytic subunit
MLGRQTEGGWVSTSQAVRTCELREAALSVDELVEAVRDPDCGAVAVFLGVVRDHDGERGVVELDYSAHPSAVDGMRRVCEEVVERTPGVRLAVTHRTGHLSVGDLAVVAVAAAPHRAEAFTACRDLIDTLKRTVPIWKHQHFADGGEQWVGLP